MKKNSILKVILLTILCVVVCTWIFPSLTFSQELVEGDRAQAGIFDVFSYSVDLFRYFPYVILMTLSIGAFYGVMYKIPAYRQLLDRIVQGFKGKENVFLIATIVLISAIVSVTGLSFGMLFVFPLIISLVLLMGYNKLVAASVTVGSVCVGLIGTTLGNSSVDYINYILKTNINNEMVTKVSLLILGAALLIYNVLSYAKKTRNSTDKVLEFVPASTSEASVVKAVKEVKEVKKEVVAKKETKKPVAKKKAPAKKTTKKTKANNAITKEAIVVKGNGKKQSIWPLVIMFDLVLIIIALGNFNWSEVAKVAWPTDALKAIRDFEILDFPIFDKLLGTSLHAFGQWSLNLEMPATIIIMTCLMGFIYGVKFDKFLEGIIDGVKRAVKPAIYMLMVYLVLIIATYHPFQLNIARFFLDMTKHLNVFTMTVVSMFAALFNVEPMYAAQSTLPYVTTVITDASTYPIIAVMFQAVYGLVMIIAPTSVILLGTLTYLDIPYTQWIKHIWKLFLELLGVLLIVFFVLTLV